MAAIGSGFGVFYIQKLLNLQFGGTSYTFIGMDFALTQTSNPGSATTIGTEPVGNGYVRLSVPVSTTMFPNISGTTTTLTNSGQNITFATSSGTGWGTIQSVFVVEHLASNILYFGDLVASQTVGGSNTFQFLTNNFSVQLT